MFLRSIALVVAVLGLAPAAVADGMPRAPVTHAAPQMWSGLFAGFHAGYGWGDTDWVFPFDEFYNDAPGERFTTKPEGGLFGQHLVLSHQFGNVVAGIGASFSFSAMRETRVGPVTSSFPDDRLRTEIDNVLTITGRLGHARNNWLLYAMGGYASAEVSTVAYSGLPVVGVEANTKERHSGWVVGGGLEYMFRPAAALGLEYSFMSLEGERHTALTTGTTSGLPYNVDVGDIGVHALTVRLSFKLTPERSQSAPLK
jgi:opacity protein-like surface antigen